MKAPIADRIRALVVINANGCWIWQKSTDRDGYAQISFGGSRVGHRVSYQAFKGEIPAGMQIDHTCHNEALAAGTCSGNRDCVHRPCVNPDHLEPVTSRTNIHRGDTLAAANAAKTHCAQGHPFDLMNTKYTTGGRRQCRRCSAKWTQANRDRKRRTSAA